VHQQQVMGLAGGHDRLAQGHTAPRPAEQAHPGAVLNLPSGIVQQLIDLDAGLFFRGHDTRAMITHTPAVANDFRGLRPPTTAPRPRQSPTRPASPAPPPAAPPTPASRSPSAGY